MSIEASILELAAAIRYLGSQMSASPAPVAAPQSPEPVAAPKKRGRPVAAVPEPEPEPEPEIPAAQGRPVVVPFVGSPMPVAELLPPVAVKAVKNDLDDPEAAIKDLLASLMGK